MRLRICGMAMILVALGTGLQAQENGPVRMTSGEKRDGDPAVSPDGKNIVFVSNRTGAFNLFMMTEGKEGVLQLTQGNKDDRHPHWSPDGKKIVFASKRTGNFELYEMSADGSSGFLQLTNREEIDEYPSYEPNGKGLLYETAAKKAIQFSTKNTIAFAQDKAQANSPRVLADGEEPLFAPDGKSIVFTSHRTKNNDIWLMNPEGGQLTQLTTNPDDDENPCFSPDGKQIAFASNRTGNYDLWVMESDGRNPRQITSAPEDETQPFWASNGCLYFTRTPKQGSANIFRIKAP